MYETATRAFFRPTQQHITSRVLTAVHFFAMCLCHHHFAAQTTCTSVSNCTAVVFNPIFSTGRNVVSLCVISGFRRDADEICAFMVILYRRFGTIYRVHLQGSRKLSRVGPIGCPAKALEDGLSRNVGTELSLYAA
jgi:hypothetical protein